MLCRDKLWDISTTARAKGWKIIKEDLPSRIPNDVVFPHPENIFRALELVAPTDVKTVVIGQDPYYTTASDGEPYATGVAFAVHGKDAPPSLRTIQKWAYRSKPPKNDLSDWATSKGLLLLNAALTVGGKNDRAQAGKHVSLWRQFFSAVLKQARTENPQLVVVAWGTKARDSAAKAVGVDWKNPPHWFCWSYHPAYLKPSKHDFKTFWETDGKRLRLAMDT